MVKVQIEMLNNELKCPAYTYADDAALDLPSNEDAKLLPGEKKIIKTGIKMAIPRGFVGLIWDRSGMAAKHSIHTMAGVIDSGYRGEIGVVMINFGKEPFSIEKNMRIAQLLIQPVVQAEIEIVKSVGNETERSEGGFGSSGK